MVRTLKTSRLLVDDRGGGFWESVAILQLTLFLQVFPVWPVSASNEFLIGLGGFNDSNVKCSTGVGCSGILQMAPNADTPPYVAGGRCLFNGTIRLLESTRTGVSSFSTTFTFSMYNADAAQNGQGVGSAVVGFAFIMVAEPRPELGYDTNAQGLQYLGILNETSSGKNSSHTFAVKFSVYDSKINPLFNDPPYDSVGILLNNMNASFTSRAGLYAENIYSEKGPSVPEYTFAPMNLSNGRLLQAWIDYEAQSKQLNVSISSQLGMKPTKPLLNETIDLSPIVQKTMYVGFSSAGNSDGEKTPSLVYSWSFNVSGTAPLLYRDSTSPRCGPGHASCSSRTSLSNVYTSVISSLALLVCMLFLLGLVLTRKKRALRKEFQLLELENLEYGPIKYTYRALRAATDGFDTSKSLAKGGWGSFFKAVLGASGREVAVKRISRMSKSSETEFIAEVRIIGRLRHRNLVQLQGWCYHRQDLLLVYELLPFGSLDHFLFDDGCETLSWNRRLQILKGVATALVYLHEECQLEKPLVHGNVKASNVILDSEYNARLGDFGLTRFYEQNQQKEDSTTTTGTFERYSSMYRPSCVKFTEKSDVQSFGALVLQVATGRRPVEPASLPPEDRSLFIWTQGLYLKKKLVEAVDKRLENDYCGEELVTVLHIGLLCCHPDPGQRPSMRRVKQMLCGESSIPPLPSVRNGGTVATGHPDWDESFRDYAAPEISLVDSPEIGLIANFKGTMGDRTTSRDSMGKRSRSYGS